MRSRTVIRKKPDDAIKKLEALAKKLDGPNAVKVGLPKDSNAYPDGTSVIAVGAAHEFGSDAQNIPQRSFLRQTMIENKKEYKRMMTRLMKKVAKGEMTKKEVLRLLGLKVQNDIIGKISDGISPELSTREGTALIDTGHLRQSITFKVGDE